MVKKFINTNKYTIINFILLVLVLGLTGLFWNGFMRNSDFKWTVEQMDYWSAIVELVIMATIFSFIILQKITGQAKIILLTLSVAIFAFLHSILVCLIVTTVYVVFTLIIGYIVCKILKFDTRIHVLFFSGFISVISLVALFSICGVGTPHYLKRWFAILFVLVVFMTRRKIIEYCKQIPNKLSVYGKVFDDKVLSCMLVIILTAICCLLGKANFCYDYDSLWYGLRGEYVLAPFKGVYDNVNLIACVYTYSKGFEFYSLVFAGLSSYGFIISINIILWLLMGIALFEILKELNASKKAAFGILVLFFLTPSITNLVNTAKPDIISLYLQTIAILYVVRAIKGKNKLYWIISFSVLLMTFAVKATSILFSTALGFVFVLFKLLNRKAVTKQGNSFWVLPLVGSIVVYARTIKLTGLPITSLIVSLLTKMGFKIKYPYVLQSVRVTSIKELLNKDFFVERLKRLFKIFFCPNNSALVTTEWTWWGLLFTISWILAIIFFMINIKKHILQWKHGNVQGFISASFIIISGLSFASMMLLEYPDGNYYMLMNLITYIYLGMEAYNIFSKISMCIYIPLIICNILLGAAISCAWSVGFTPIAVENWGYYNHVEKYKEVIADSKGIRDLYNFMSENNDKRSLFISYREDEMFILPGITEIYQHQRAWGGYVFESDEKLYEYATKTDIDYFIVENSTIDADGQISMILDSMVDKSEIQLETEMDGFKLYSIK